MTHQAVLGTTQVGRKNWQSHKWMDRSFDYASMQLAMAGIVRQTRRGSQGERRISPCVRGKSMDQVLTDCLSRLCVPQWSQTIHEFAYSCLLIYLSCQIEHLLASIGQVNWPLKVAILTSHFK